MDNPTKKLLGDRHYFGPGLRRSDDYEQFWIRYKPDRAWRRVIREKKQFFSTVMVCLAVLLAGTFMLGGVNAAVAAISLMVACFLLIKLHFLLYPTHIALTDAGLQLHWLHSFCNLAGPLIEWERLSHVSIGKGNNKFVKQPTLEFNVYTSGILRRKRMALQVLCNGLCSGWMTDRGKVFLALEAIASSDDRKRLQIGLKKYLPTYRIEPSVADQLELSIRMETYTDLWMESLSSSSKRLRAGPLVEGTRVHNGRYEVLCEIGAGGQAIVYEAVDSQTKNNKGEPLTVVLKEFILPAQAGAGVRKRVLDNIQREADMLKPLGRHPNIVKLLDFFVDDERAYLVLERIKGISLKASVEADGAYCEYDAVLLAMQMCEILGYLHRENLVHRDFTPDNLIFGYGRILKLVDFNVAQQLEADATKSVVGKHAYIPPEQFRGQATNQSDIYALGASLYFCLTGEDPEPITVSEPRNLVGQLSEEINDIVRRATALELKQRYPDCRELKADLLALKERLESQEAAPSPLE